MSVNPQICSALKEVKFATVGYIYDTQKCKYSSNLFLKNYKNIVKIVSKLRLLGRL